MSAFTVRQSGGDYSTLNAAVAASDPAGTISIEGTWSADDTTNVTWNDTCVVTADASSKQIGRPFQSGDTHYRLRPTSGHVFTVTADVDITDLDVQSESSGVSDEIFRSAGASSITATNCMLGFTGNTDQQDLAYTENNSTKSYNFIQCFFYDVGRSIVDQFNGGENGTFTINFNSCGSLNIGANGARNDGSWVGVQNSSSGDTVNVNVHNCLMSINDTFCFRSNNTTVNLNIDCTYSIASVTTANISGNEDTEDLTGTVGGYTWTAAADPGAGDRVGLVNITSGTYNPALTDHANNDAIAFHAVVTDAGLTIPDLDILGQTRDKTTPSFDVGPSAVTVVAGGGGETITATALGSGEAFGSASVQVGVVAVSPSAVSGGEQHGATNLAPGVVALAPSGLGPAEAHGSQVLAVGPVALSPSGLTTGEAVGSLTLSVGGIIVELTGLASAEALGDHTLSQGGVILVPSGIDAGEGHGAHAVAPGLVLVSPSGLISGEGLGSPQLSFLLVPTSVASAEALGALSVSPGAVSIVVTGLSSVEAHGDQLITQGGTIIQAASISTGEGHGAHTLTTGQVILTLAGLASGELVGTPLVGAGSTLVMPSAIASLEGWGDVSLTLGPVLLSPNGLASLESLGGPTVALQLQFLSPTGVTSLEAVGVPFVITGTGLQALRVFNAHQRRFVVGAHQRRFIYTAPQR